MNHLLKPIPPDSTAELLHQTMSLLEAACFDHGGPPTASYLVALRPARRGLDIGLLDLGTDPVTGLQGFDAPPGWWGLGVITSGEACHHDGTDDAGRLIAPPGPSSRWPVAVIHLVARAGPAATVHHHRGGGAPRHHSHTDGESWNGLLDDHLRRALGLPTPAPPASTLELWTLVWLDALATRAARGELAGACWPELVAAHPVRVLAAEAAAEPEVLAWAGEDVVRSGVVLADTWSWPLLREAARSGRDVLGTTSPRLAAWLDDGLYARLHLARYPAVADLLDLLDTVLDRPVRGNLHAACRAWSVQT